MIESLRRLNDNLDRLLHCLYKDRVIFDRIYYINLDKRTDRREHIENQIRRVLDDDLDRTRRISGIIYDNFSGRLKGAIGCTMSHLKAINESIVDSLENVIILEDDFEFICDKYRFKKDLERFLKTHPHYDILLFGVNSQSIKYNTTSSNNNFIKVSFSQTTSGYMVSRKCFIKMRNVCERSIDRLKKKQNVQDNAIDIEWNSIMKEGNVYTFPYRVGKQIASYSDIEMRDVDYNV